MQVRIIPLLLLMLLQSNTHALSIGLRCLNQGNEYVRQAYLNEAQLPKHKRTIHDKEERKSNKYLLMKKKAIRACIDTHIKKTKRTADCSHSPPPSINSPNVTEFNDHNILCYELLEAGRTRCLNQITHLKREQREKILLPCLHQVEKNATACASKFITKPLTTPPYERYLFSLKPLLQSDNKMKTGSEVWVCINNKPSSHPSWMLATLVKKGKLTSLVKIKNRKQLLNISNQQIVSKNIHAYTPTAKQRKQYQSRSLVDKVLTQVFPLVSAIAENKPLPPKPKIKNLLSRLTIKNKQLTLQFNPQMLDGYLLLKLIPYLHIDKKPTYQCIILNNPNHIDTPPICRDKGPS